MKRQLLTLLSIVSVAIASPAVAMASPANWTVQQSTPFSATGGQANQKNFNVSVSVSSTEAADSMTVNVYRDSTLLGTFSEDSSTYGNSWIQAVTVPSDGTYTIKTVASNSNGDPDKVVQNVVTVDTTAPSSPSYGGKTTNGNSHTITFSVPASSDITKVKIFASTSSSFTANASSQVGEINVTPGQTASFVYNAPDSSPRYFAIQGFDASGNGSALVGDSVAGDSGITATSASQNSTGQAADANDGLANGQVASNSAGEQEKDSSSEDATANQENDNKTDWATVWVTLAILASLYAGYQWFMQKADKE